MTVAGVLALPPSSCCSCAPGVGGVQPDGLAICDACGLVMRAATLGELLTRTHQDAPGRTSGAEPTPEELLACQNLADVAALAARKPR